MHSLALERQASNHLNLIRGVAALAVLCGHLRALFFQDLGHVFHARAVTTILYAATALGHEAVMVFFVLSGFFVAGSAIRMAHRWSWAKYLGNRVVRLYLVLLPALLLTAVVDQVALRMPLGELYFFHPIPSLNNPVPLVAAISPQVFLGNALFLQTIVVPSFGSNSPLWSLANEFWYYMLFPLILVPFCQSRLSVRLACLGTAVAIGILLPRTILLYFLIWLLGAAMHFLPRRPAMRSGPVLLLRTGTLALFGASLFLTRLNLIAGLPADFVIGLSFAIFMYCLVGFRLGTPVSPQLFAPPVDTWYARFSGALAGCSYSIYAIHLPLLTLIRTTINAGRWQPTPGHTAMGFLIGVGVIGAGYIFSKATEARTGAVRARLFAWIGVRPAHDLAAEAGAGS